MKIVNVVGARPNFMKIAPLMHAYRSYKGLLHPLLVHTGQHYDNNMSDNFFKELDVPKPDINLGVGSGSHAEQTAWIMLRFERVLIDETPDLVLVVGDVNSTMSCTITAAKLGIKTAHVEAGLRSFDMTMPEEINRILTDRISDFLFVTEESGVKNLIAEGIEEEKIHLVGNVMIDTLLKQLEILEAGQYKPDNRISDFLEQNDPYAVLTLHRPSNVDCQRTFEGIWKALSEISTEIPILFPVHPRTRSKIEEYRLPSNGIRYLDPVGYMDMLCAVKDAALVMTDSGGLQEETTVLGVPCVTIRENTERPSTIEIGTNYLTGSDPEKILEVVLGILSGETKKGRVPPLWDGRTSERIVEVLISSF